MSKIDFNKLIIDICFVYMWLFVWLNYVLFYIFKVWYLFIEIRLFDILIVLINSIEINEMLEMFGLKIR